MEKRYVYTEPLSPSKKAALLLSLQAYPNLEHREVAITKESGVVPTQYDETAKAGLERLQHLTNIGLSLNEGDIVLSIQKGVHLDEDCCVFLAAVSFGVVEKKEEPIEVFCLFSEEILLPTKLYYLVKGGDTLYEAYGELFGEVIKNKIVPLITYLTGQKEEEWLSRPINNALLPSWNYLKK